MSNPFVDTDVIIRLLTSDDVKKQEEAAFLFEQVRAGRLTVGAPCTVIADAVYVLSSPRLYNLTSEKIRELLSPLVRLSKFKIPHRQSVLRALDLYATLNIDFGDALIAALMEKDHSQIIYTYDTHFDRIEGIKRCSPGGLS